MRLSVVIAILFAAVFCTPVYAESISLADLINNNGSIQSGDKLFDEFEYNSTGDMPFAEDVNVITFEDNLGNFGITFNGYFVDLWGNNGSDALIRFRVTATDPNKLISDAHLGGNPNAIGNAIMEVHETFLYNASAENTMSIYCVNPGNNRQNADVVLFNGLYRSLWVQKDIGALAQTEGSAASLSFIDQSFSQVPEPTCVVFLLSGLALLCFRVRRVR